jgi:hypothetical protein
VGMQNFFVSLQIANPQILASFDNHKSANFLRVPVRKLQIRKIVMINPQISSSQFANPQICKEKAVHV